MKLLLDAISAKNVDRVKELTAERIGLVLETGNGGQTPVEAAYSGFRGSKPCGDAMIAALVEYIKSIEKKAGVDSIFASPSAAQ